MLNRLMKILIIFGILLLLRHLNAPERARTRRSQTYRRLISFQLVSVLTEANAFRRYTRFEPQIFLTRLYRPIQAALNRPRGYYSNSARQRRQRSYFIPSIYRLIRFCMFFAGWSRVSLSFVFDQSITTTRQDIKHISQAIVYNLYDDYVNSPPPGSPNYNALVGAGVFAEHFPTMVYALDICKLKVSRPILHQRDFYDGHHGEHNVGYLVACNGHGHPTYCYGPLPGRYNDLSYYIRCGFYLQPYRYVLNGHYIAADRIFRYYPPPILCAYCGYAQLTVYQMFYNHYHARARVIIENLFGRIKRCIPMWRDYRFSLDDIDLYWRTTLILISIIIQHQSPLRRV
eukprot:4909_1